LKSPYLSKDKWFLDSGCSRHMTGDQSKFHSIKPHKGGSVTFGDNSKGKVIGIGTIGISSSLSIDDVLLVKGLKHNLFSISQLCDKGYDVLFKSDKCIVKKDNVEVFHALRNGNVYSLLLCELHDQDVKCLVSSNEDSWLWHRRLGHASMDLISKLSKNELVKGLPKTNFSKDKTCSACQIGKQIKSSFKRKKDITTSRPLELIHMDLFGPERIASLGGKLYAFVIVDDFSRFTWVFFLTHKNEVHTIFTKFCKRVENEKECKIKSIRSDRGREFDNQDVERFCDENGYNHNLSAPRTPQQNGVVERKNRSLQEMARTMLNEHNSPRSLWAEAVSTSCYVINRVIIRKLLNKTPYDLWNKRKPNIGYFKVFGCKCFVLNDKDNLGKFEPKSDEGIFLGYSSRSKAFRVFNKRTRVVVESIHVVFDESPLSPIRCSLDENEDVVEIEKNVENLDLNGPSHKDLSKDVPKETRLEAIRMLLAFASHKNFKLYQMDVKSAFLNGIIEEEVYVDQPPGFESCNYPNHVFKLSKALYGLKQAPRAWYERLSGFLLVNGFIRGKIDNTLFTKTIDNNLLVIQIYVDDIIFGSTNSVICEKFASSMQNEFEMSMMGELTFFLGLQIKQTLDGIFVCQSKYVKDLLKKFGLEEVKHAHTPMSSSLKLDKDEKGTDVDIKKYRGMIGSLLYLTASRPDIMFSVCLCARFQSCPKESHLCAVKRIFRYLSYTTFLGLWYPRHTSFDLVGYSDADFGGCKVDRKSTSGTCHFIGQSLVSWSCKKQNSIALSTAEAEYIAAGSCCAQTLYIKQQLEDFGLYFDHIPIMCDNTSAICISKNPIQHSRTKHIEIRYHFLRDHVSKGDIDLIFVTTEKQLADIFTKPLQEERFCLLRREIGMIT
ncbi:uncharacterized protein LOC132277441, partial [Cornus florida]|uniref:uncharacterized protein LOC132277441 n=1 Tax=Cornus florida TaxID=4283 RepID=UPI0028A1E743